MYYTIQFLSLLFTLLHFISVVFTYTVLFLSMFRQVTCLPFVCYFLSHGVFGYFLFSSTIFSASKPKMQTCSLILTLPCFLAFYAFFLFAPNVTNVPRLWTNIAKLCRSCSMPLSDVLV